MNTAFLGTAGAVLRWEGSGEGAPVRVHVKCHHLNKSGEACKEDIRALLRALGCDDAGLDQWLRTWGHLPLVYLSVPAKGAATEVTVYCAPRDRELQDTLRRLEHLVLS